MPSPVDAERTKFGVVTHKERGVFLGVSHAPIARNGALAHHNFGTLHTYAQTMRLRTTKFGVKVKGKGAYTRYSASS